MPVPPADLSAKRAIAADRRWAFEPDRTAATAAGRKAFLDRFEREVDPEGKLSPEERSKRAKNLRRAHFRALAIKSAAARREGTSRRRQGSER